MLGLPTGSSPILIYKHLVQRHKAGHVSFRNVITFNMVRATLPPMLHSSLAGVELSRETDPIRMNMLASHATTQKATTASCTSTSSPTST